MSEAVLRIKEQIDALSDEERSELMDALLELEERVYQLGGPNGKWLTEEELTAELERRNAEMEGGHVPGVPWGDVLADLKKELP